MIFTMRHLSSYGDKRSNRGTRPKREPKNFSLIRKSILSDIGFSVILDLLNLQMSEIFPTIRGAAFKPSQIVCLESYDERLYGEVIQIVEQRQTCWVRPILIVQQKVLVVDLRSSSDLILPLRLFRLCFDTEIIPFLTQLNQLHPISSNQSPSFDLNLFVQQVWQTSQDKF